MALYPIPSACLSYLQAFPSVCVCVCVSLSFSEVGGFHHCQFHNQRKPLTYPFSIILFPKKISPDCLRSCNCSSSSHLQESLGDGCLFNTVDGLKQHPKHWCPSSYLSSTKHRDSSTPQIIPVQSSSIPSFWVNYPPSIVFVWQKGKKARGSKYPSEDHCRTLLFKPLAISWAAEILPSFCSPCLIYFDAPSC